MAFSADEGPRRILLVGWDGATWSLLDRLLQQDRLPNLRSLIDEGFRAPLTSTVPPVTAPSWSAMATGLGPGRSGILGFRQFDLSRLSGFSGQLVSSAELQGRTLFEHAARQGESLSLVGWPMTWPALPIPGSVVLAGWPRPQTDLPPVWPRALARSLGPWSEGDPRPRLGRATLEEEIAAASWWDRRHGEIACKLLRERDDGLVAVVFSGTDHLAHKLWGDPRLDEHYQRVDAMLGELRAAAGENVATILVSDHGFGPAPRRELHLGRWLEREGWLKLREGTTASSVGWGLGTLRQGVPPALWREVRDRLPDRVRRWGFERAAGMERIDSAATTATRFSLYENWEGIRLRSEDPSARSRLSEALRDLEQVAGVFEAEQVFPGAPKGTVPDLVVELSEDFRGGEGLGEGPLVTEVAHERLESCRATHRMEGVLVAAGPGLRARTPPQDPRVEDVGLSALALAGIALPDGLDGRPWVESIELPVRYIDSAELAGLGRPLAEGLDPHHQRELKESLRSLGYS